MLSAINDDLCSRILPANELLNNDGHVHKKKLVKLTILFILML